MSSCTCRTFVEDDSSADTACTTMVMVCATCAAKKKSSCRVMADCPLTPHLRTTSAGVCCYNCAWLDRVKEDPIAQRMWADAVEFFEAQRTQGEATEEELQEMLLMYGPGLIFHMCDVAREHVDDAMSNTYATLGPALERRKATSRVEFTYAKYLAGMMVKPADVAAARAFLSATNVT